MIKRNLWRICRLGYMTAAKPLLFLISPDKTHSMMIQTTSVTGRVPVLRGFVRLIFSRASDNRLIQNYHGVNFKSPVGLSAGLIKTARLYR